MIRENFFVPYKNPNFVKESRKYKLMPEFLDFFTFFIIIIYVLSAVFIGIEARKRKIGIIKAVILSLLLTPIAGYIFVSKSKYDDHIPQKQYKCRRCGHTYVHYHKYCPTCESNGRFIKLIKLPKK